MMAKKLSAIGAAIVALAGSPAHAEVTRVDIRQADRHRWIELREARRYGPLRHRSDEATQSNRGGPRQGPAKCFRTRRILLRSLCASRLSKHLLSGTWGCSVAPPETRGFYWVWRPDSDEVF